MHANDLVHGSVTGVKPDAHDLLPRAARAEHEGSSKKLLRIQKDRNGPLVRQLEGHHRLENAGLHVHAEVAQRSAVVFVELIGFVAWRGLDEAWPALTTCVAIKGELRNNERGSAEVHQREVHLSGFVGEDAQRGGFFRKVSGRVGRIPLSHPEQYDQTDTNLTGDTAIHQHASLADTLDDSSHQKKVSFAAIPGFEQARIACAPNANILVRSSLDSKAVLILLSVLRFQSSGKLKPQRRQMEKFSDLGTLNSADASARNHCDVQSRKKLEARPFGNLHINGRACREPARVVRSALENICDTAALQPEKHDHYIVNKERACG
jgi:hypothetical protein